MRISNKVRKVLPALIVAVAVSGCATEATKYSGFLRDYSMLKPVADSENFLRYDNPKISFRSYTKFMIDPVIVHFAPKAEGTAIDPTNLKELTDFFNTRLDSLSPPLEPGLGFRYVTPHELSIH